MSLPPGHLLHVPDVGAGRPLQQLPEIGDMDKPKLVLFRRSDLFLADASKAFLDQVEQTVKLIRSKGVGVFSAPSCPRICLKTCFPSWAPASSTRCAPSPR